MHRHHLNAATRAALAWLATLDVVDRAVLDDDVARTLLRAGCVERAGADTWAAWGDPAAGRGGITRLSWYRATPRGRRRAASIARGREIRTLRRQAVKRGILRHPNAGLLAVDAQGFVLQQYRALVRLASGELVIVGRTLEAGGLWISPTGRKYWATVVAG